MSSVLRDLTPIFDEPGRITDAHWCPTRQAFFFCKPETSSVISVNRQGEVLCRWHFVEPVYFIKPARSFPFVLGCQSGLVRWEVDNHHYASLGIPHSEGVHSKLVSGEVDQDGNLWFLRLDVGEKLSIGGLFCASNDHSAQLVETGLSKNALIRFSPEQVFLVDPNAPLIQRYTIQRGFVQHVESDDQSVIDFSDISNGLVYDPTQRLMTQQSSRWRLPNPLVRIGVCDEDRVFVVTYDDARSSSSVFGLTTDAANLTELKFSA